MWFKLFESFTPTSDSNTQIDGTKLVPTAFITSRQLALKSVQPKKKNTNRKAVPNSLPSTGKPKTFGANFSRKVGFTTNVEKNGGTPPKINI